MGQSKFWKGVTNVLFPPSMAFQNDRDIDAAYQNQAEAGQNAQDMMNKQFDYLGGLNEPIIKIGDQQLKNLQEGVDRGAFLPDEGIFNNYKINTMQNVGPSQQFSYGQQAPNFTGAPAAVTYDDKVQPGQYQSGQYRYQGPQAPGQVGYSQNQFSPYQQTAQQPDIYRAPEIGAGNYYDPNQQKFDIGNDPVYQRRIQEANKATEASAAARGMQLSGSNLKALQENASGIAGEEGAAAYGRYADQQNRLQGAMNYRNEDEYGRTLDMAGIRAGESDRSIGQWNTDRNFGQAAATENLGNALAVQGQNYGQYADNRGMGLSEYQTNLADKQYGYGSNIGQFNQNLQNQLQTQGQAWNQAYDPYLANLGQYNQNRAFDFGTFQDQNANQFSGTVYNNQMGQANADNYNAMLQGRYDRSTNRGLTNYGMIGDLANIGMTGRQNMGSAAGDYFGSMADIGIGTSNAYAAAQAAKVQNSGLLNTLLGK